MAQLEEPQLPQQWFDERSPLSDQQSISICLDSRLPEHDLHERLAQELASALLVDLEIVEVGRERHVEADYEHLYIDLINRCSIYLGFKLYPGAYPEWLDFTRPLYQARFVLITNQEGLSNFGDLAPGSRVGVTQGTDGDIRFLAYNNSLPAASRYHRLPLGQPDIALKALAEGRVDALIIWEPWWQHLAQGQPEYAEFSVINAPLVSEPAVPVGAALYTERTALRSLVDQAIQILTQDGTVQRVIEESSVPAQPAR